MSRSSAFVLTFLLAGGLGAVAGAIWHSQLEQIADELAVRAGLKPLRGAASSTPPSSRTTVWYCPMHPSYRSDEPGNCPICAMTLVPLAQDEVAAAPAAAGGDASGGGNVEGRVAVHVSADRQQLIGVRTSAVERRPVTRSIRAVGRVDPDERRLAAVNLKFAGWIEGLKVKAVGDLVRRGDPLFTVYSPELYEAERTYLVARKTLPADDPTVRGARERLLLLDLTEQQVIALEERGEPERTTAVLSRVTGTVLKRDAVEGGAIEPGRDLFEIADLSSLWVMADVYENEIPLVAVGQEAQVEFAGMPAAPRSARIDYVYPTLNEATRTVRVRLEIDNADGALKPGMYATVTLAVDLGEQLVIDRDAVLDTGTRQIVFVEPQDGHFEPREVKLGDRSDGHAVVIGGLSEGERVATRAAFLLDSESRLQAALKAHATGGAEHHH